MARVEVGGISASTCVLALTCVLGLPTLLTAQQASGIAGVVRDASGAVLPGVTVEAASPALIENVRTAITDDQGRYNIVNLRPGTYGVTFTLTGFRTLRREGIELVGGFTASVNAELQVGALKETITVTGASPLVDIQNTQKQTRVSDELLAVLPSSTGGVTMLMTVTPGVTGVADVGGTLGLYRSMDAPALTRYHGRTGMKQTYDGMGVLNTILEGFVSYMINYQNVEEMALESSGISAESASSGFATNAIPKEGGNRFTVTAHGLFSNESMNSDNLSDEFRRRGISTVEKVKHIWDTGVVVGGPVRRDRLWFLGNVRMAESRNLKSNIFHNKTHGTPFYTADFDRPGDRFEDAVFGGGRLTWRASPKNKVNAFFEYQHACRCPHEGFYAPEAAYGERQWPVGLGQVTWSSPRTERLLLEGGWSVAIGGYQPWAPPGTTFEDIQITDLSSGLPYNAASQTLVEDRRWSQRFSVSYVPGTHAFKFGIYAEQMRGDIFSGYDRKVGFKGEEYGQISYSFFQGVPVSVTIGAWTPLETRATDIGLYAQDQWAIDRLTLNYGVRFDYFHGHTPETSAPASAYLPARSFPQIKGIPRWTDVSPRLGGAFDLFGNGRTAVKAYIGRYVGREATGVALANNPFATSINSTSRTWNDSRYPVGDPRQGNYAVDCDLRNPLENGECGGLANVNFGKVNPRATRWADEVLRGFGVRRASWDFTLELERQFGSRVSATGGYYRSWHGNFRATDNVEVTPADFDTYCITAPRDSRLPGGGGYQVCGLTDVKPSKFGLVQNVIRPASDFGKQTQISDFFNVSFTARLGAGRQFGGGVDTGRTVEDSCFVVDSVQNLLNCRVVSGFKDETQFKLYGTYELPAGFSVAGTLRNLPGAWYLANYSASNAEIAPSLGRNLASCGTQVVCNTRVTVPLIAPKREYENRYTQVDLRLSRTFRPRTGLRLQLNADVYNAFNSSPLLSVNNTYGERWRHPASGVVSATGSGVLVGRLLQVGGRLSF